MSSLEVMYTYTKKQKSQHLDSNKQNYEKE